MKTVDYINELIKERDELKNMCKSHMETIRLMRRELTKLNNIISKKDKTINKLENESINLKTQKELNNIKNEMNKMQIEYEYLQNKYNSVVNENVELNSIFDDVENTCDSD